MNVKKKDGRYRGPKTAHWFIGEGAALFKESVLKKKRKKYKIVSPAGEKIKETVSSKENRETRAREKNKVIFGEQLETGKGPKAFLSKI